MTEYNVTYTPSAESEAMRRLLDAIEQHLTPELRCRLGSEGAILATWNASGKVFLRAMACKKTYKKL